MVTITIIAPPPLRLTHDNGDHHASVPMPEPGRPSARAMVDWYGGDTLAIDVRGQRILFEFSARFGPMAVTKDGRERDLKRPGPFLRAVSLWAVQGKRVVDGVAIWHEPRKPVLQHIGGRQYRVIQDGEVGHDW